MSRYFDEMQGVLQRHGGTVQKFIGDAIMAVFGVPSVHEDDALRAVRGVAEMREHLHLLNEEIDRRWHVRLRVRIGINTGEVVAGDPSRDQNLVLDDMVNVAARPEQAAAPDEILQGFQGYLAIRQLYIGAGIANPAKWLDETVAQN
jgi:class 3 adenylate cyclase